MSDAIVIDGKALAKEVKDGLAVRIQTLKRLGKAVRLDAVIVGANQSAHLYARNQSKACGDVGIEYVLHDMTGVTSQEEVVTLIEGLNANPLVTAIMVHMPLPEGIDQHEIQSRISVEKDVEGVNPANIGNIVFGRRSLVPCTALAVMEMIESTGIDLKGARAVCVGASTIVGKPVAVLLMQAEATVISTNVYTENQFELTKTADILISAAGVPKLISSESVKKGAIVVDVGINRVTDTDGKTRTIGDVDYETVKYVAGHISPVPGGVGPMTVAMLLRNTVQAAEN